MNLTQGTARQPIQQDQVARLRASGVLIEDSRRERPFYFDGRFLAARDLIRDQQYFLTREADLGQASGSGVATGLFVNEGGAPQTLRVQAGHGVTPSGELVLLPRAIDVQLANIPVAEQLSAKFGLSRLPVPPLRSRTGLFVLALRPVEFTANPIGAYPTSITGQRTVEDGDVIEATAVVLVPWQDDGAADALDARRGRAARAIFTQDTAAGVSANVLPLAMIALQNNTVVWIDEAMARRELGADRGDLPGLGFAPRGLRLAHLMQHQAHLADVVSRSGGRGFPASTHFPALPPAGPLPPGVIHAQDFTQNYFPAEVDVDFSIIPEDELPALIEEALALQPIDLTASAEALDSTAVMVLAPVPRHEWRAVVARLSLGTATLATRLVKPAAPNLIAQRRPFEVLQKLRLPRVTDVAPVVSGAEAEWQRLARLGTLWFVRRRHLAYRDDLVGSYREISGSDERELEVSLNKRITELGLTERLDFVVQRATPAAASVVIGLLAGKRLQESPVLTAAALGMLTDAITTAETQGGKPVLDKTQALGVSAVLSAPEKNDALLMLLKREAEGPIPSDELLRIASNTEWNEEPVDDGLLEKRLFRRLEGLGLSEEWATVYKNAEPKVTQAVIRFLSDASFEKSPLLTAAALGLLAEPVVQGGFLKDTSIIKSVQTDLANPGGIEGLADWIKLETRRPLPADELRKVVATTAEWRPKRVLFPTRSVAAKAAAKVPAKKAVAKTAAKKAPAKTASKPAAKASQATKAAKAAKTGRRRA
ncbi:hypothetical protein [Hydrogenophaga sp. BPS33]|uniref:hypothetical protein n=1 Tax=Hydrogenophaga sp. BPS33 TaxID=2651974 RepID=UPI00131F8D70|nr:hypothetical protein [Hydrogenophaga sp. BPS33]QHE85170.1 hypothetical protein F9K07_09860 [Hydrogenophaga sp. BPS33]